MTSAVTGWRAGDGPAARIGRPTRLDAARQRGYKVSKASSSVEPESDEVD